MDKRTIVIFRLISLIQSVQHNQENLSDYRPAYVQIESTIRPHNYLVSITEIPYHVLIVYNNLYCSGGLIHSRMVLTVASCLINQTKVKPVVKMGVSSVVSIGYLTYNNRKNIWVQQSKKPLDIASYKAVDGMIQAIYLANCFSSQMIPVVDIKIHEYYKHLNILDNDIAILVLKRNVMFGSDVKKLVLIYPRTALEPKQVIDVSGWGSTNLQSTFVNQLLKTQMIVIQNEECISIIGPLLTRSNFCAKYQPAKRLSDNGGPAVVNKYYLVGILSYGGTNEDEKIAIITNVSYFQRWIEININFFNEKYCIPVKPDDYPSDETLEELPDSSN